MDEQYKESGEPDLERPPRRLFRIRPIYMITAAVCFGYLAGFYLLINASTNRLIQKIDGQTQRIYDTSNRLAKKIDGDGNSLVDQAKGISSDLRNITYHIDQIVDTAKKDQELMKNHGPLATRMGDTYQDLHSTERKFREMARKDGRGLSEDEKVIIQNLKGQYDQASADLHKDLDAYLNSPHREK